MLRFVLAGIFIAVLVTSAPAAQSSYEVQRLADDVFVAIAKPGGRASSNAFFVSGKDYVVAGGAHMSRDAIHDLWTAIAETAGKPIRYFVLAHHHSGYSYADLDFPPDVMLLMSGNTWKNLEKEVRKPVAPVILFSDALTLKIPGMPTVVLANIGQGHTDGDVLAILPDQRVVYAGDLLYVKSVGYMGNGHMRSWLQALDFLSGLDAQKYIPGFGPSATKADLDDFRKYFREFLTAVLEKLQAGIPAETVRKTFVLPEYAGWAGYNQFLRDNAGHALQDLKEDLTEK